MELFHTHIKNFSEISAPLSKLTRKDSPYKGGLLPPAAISAFQVLKLALTSNPFVAFPRSDRQFALIVDASTGTASVEGDTGAILAQVDQQGTSMWFHMDLASLLSMIKIIPPIYDAFLQY